ncbi:serine/threonine protein kinase, partial [Planktothrix sp. FACHB-1355]|nr:serine/threonine protein kinase [Planktothrix sp. FACHB-1355]
RVWIGLVAWIDPTLLIFSLGMPWLVMGIVLGVKGNEWAWKSRQWRSISEFKAHQRAWAIAAWLILAIVLAVVLAIAVIFGLLLLAGISSSR